MRPYGRKEYTDYGEIGTVTAHNDDGTLQMTLDGDQPFARWMWGAKAKRTDHGGMVHKVLGTNEVRKLADVYRENGRRLESVAASWFQAAEVEERGDRGHHEDD